MHVDLVVVIEVVSFVILLVISVRHLPFLTECICPSWP